MWVWVWVPEEGVLFLLQQGPQRVQLCSGVDLLLQLQLLPPQADQGAVDSASFVLAIISRQAQSVPHLDPGAGSMSPRCGSPWRLHHHVTYFHGGVEDHLQRRELLCCFLLRRCRPGNDNNNPAVV